MFSATKGGSPSGYQISRSVRLRSSASAYFNRTPGSAGNRTTWTWSGWVKRGSLGSNQSLFSVFDYVAGTTNNQTLIRFTSSDNIEFEQFNLPSYNGQKITSAVYRDPSAWYHIVCVWDTSNATASNRMQIYVNGSQITSFGTSSDPSLNANSEVNRAFQHTIGTFYNANFGSPINSFDGYLTEVNFIDGQALTPLSFGSTNATTGVWQPIKYTGTYGTNGFYLNFADNSAATAAAIGADYSGNGNNWTPNNIFVTSGSTYDYILDVPTQWADGGNGRGNYCVINPLSKPANVTLSNANLTAAMSTTSGHRSVASTFYVDTGSWFWEITPTTVGSGSAGIGVANTSFTIGNEGGTNTYFYYADGTKNLNNTSTSYGASYTSNDVIGVAFDATNGTLTFYKNGTSQGQITGIPTGVTYVPFMCSNTSVSASTFVANFGQRPFAFSPPTGFKALNTLNLPTPTILKGNQYFDATTYTGNSGTQSVVNSGAMQPDLVWIKDRSAVGQHVLTDSVRGVDRQLFSSLTNAEQTSATGITSLNSNGFTTGANPSPTGATNSSPDAFIAWQWKEGATQGFDIVTYTGNGSTQAVNHSLGVTPSMVIVKGRSGTGRNWMVQFGKTNADRYLMLNSTAAYTIDSTPWNTTNPTSTTFTVGANANTNQSSETFVAYLFAEVAGYSAFGSYTGNGSADGTFVFTGFLPRYVMVKRTDSTGGWAINDTARDPTNINDAYLAANTSGAEIQPEQGIDILSNGFKLRSNGTITNASGGTFIYLAFASNPFKNSLAF